MRKRDNGGAAGAAAGRSDNRKSVNLALQGGGTHGAFTWGVLDRLLEDGRLVIEAISGTSAGAMNAAVLAQGYTVGGAEGARAALDGFWDSLAAMAQWSPVQRSWYDRATGNWNLDDSPAALWLDGVNAVLSPYQTNPLNISPLRDLLLRTIDIPRVRACDRIKLFIAATNVRTGKIRVFERPELTLDMLLASACLPQVFQAVIIDGDPYWDGGYMGNPAIFPLIYESTSPDVVIVQINPLTREGVPRTAAEITNRLNEITFNSSLMREMRAIAFASRLLEAPGAGGPEVERLRKMYIHLIEAEEAMETLGVVSKLNSDPEFLHYLKQLGRRTAERWLERNFDAIGQRSSIDVREKFL